MARTFDGTAAETHDRGSIRWRRVVAAGLAGGALATVMAVANLLNVTIPPPTSASYGYVWVTSPPENAIEVVLNQGDGQAAYALALDPLLQDPDAFLEGATAASFFATRPLLGYVAWAGSFGQPALAPWAVLFAGIVSAGLAAAAAVGFSQLRGAGDRDRYAVAVLLLPGSLTVLDWTGPDLLGLAMTIAALAVWLSPNRPRPWAAAVLFALAGLSRESMLLIPAVFGAWLLWSRRLGWKQVVQLAVAPAAYVVWTLVVRIRFEMGPEHSAARTSVAWPFTEMLPELGRFGFGEYLAAALGVGLVVAAVVRARDDVCTWIAVAYLLVAPCLDRWLWQSVQGFSRVLLPMYAFALLALIVPRGQPAPGRLCPSDVQSDSRRLPGRLTYSFKLLPVAARTHLTYIAQNSSR